MGDEWIWDMVGRYPAEVKMLDGLGIWLSLYYSSRFYPYADILRCRHRAVVAVCIAATVLYRHPTARNPETL